MVKFETQLVRAQEDPDPLVQLVVKDAKFGHCDVPPLLPLAAVGRLRDQLSAYLDTVADSSAVGLARVDRKACPVETEHPLSAGTPRPQEVPGE